MRTLSRRPLSGVSIALLAALAPAQNLILNGDFENNTAVGCAYNQTNPMFTTVMANATAFGTGNEIDVMNDPSSCLYGLPPKSGTTKIAIASNRGVADAFSFDLSSPVAAGSPYTLSFYMRMVSDFSDEQGAVEIGLSNASTSFGTEILSVSANIREDGWTRIDHTFTAPLTAGFLTVTSESGRRVWNHLDAFSLVPGVDACGTCVVRNGTGPNPIDYTCLTPPILGAIWVTEIATDLDTISTHVAFSSVPHAGQTLLGGELLLAPAPAPLFAAGSGMHSLALPPSPSLAGLTVYTQGFRVERSPAGIAVVPLNAIDALLGV